jgi:GT2 family glycosyltransferase
VTTTVTTAVTTTVVMLSRDRLAYTSRALTSLAATVGDLEWIVVDNGSRDGSVDYLRAWAASGDRRRLVCNGEDPGAASARNQGLALARGEYVLFVDNDVLLDDVMWLERMVTVLAADPTIAGASPLLLYPGDSGLVQCAGGAVTAQGWIGLPHRGQAVGNVDMRVREQAWAPSAALLFRRDILQRAGGFDTAFDPIALLEDVDLCYRIRHLGGSIVFVGEARLRHFEGTTFQHLGADLRRYWRRHARVLRKRWGHVIAAGPFHQADDLGWTDLVRTTPTSIVRSYGSRPPRRRPLRTCPSSPRRARFPRMRRCSVSASSDAVRSRPVAPCPVSPRRARPRPAWVLISSRSMALPRCASSAWPMWMPTARRRPPTGSESITSCPTAIG